MFLQDIAGVGLEDVNLNYVENMAILLQSLDADGNPDNGIQITEVTHAALADYVDPSTGLPLNMAEAGKQMLSNVLDSLGIEFTADTETDPDPSDGRQNVFETVALEHVADTITDSASDDRQPDLFDVRLEVQIDAGQGVIEYAYITDGETVTAMTFSAYGISERTGQPVGLLANANPQQVTLENMVIENVRVHPDYEEIVDRVEYDDDTKVGTIYLVDGVTPAQLEGLTLLTASKTGRPR